MKNKLVLLLIIVFVASCKKDNYQIFTGTHSNYLKLTFKGIEYNITGSIVFYTPYSDEEYENHLLRRCPNYSTDFSYNNNEKLNDIMISMTTPVYSHMIHDSLVNKKYQLETGYCGYETEGRELFGFDLNLTIDGTLYHSELNNDTANYYNKITKITRAGTQGNTGDVFEIQGEFNIVVTDFTSSPNIDYIIDDGKYSITLITRNNMLKTGT